MEHLVKAEQYSKIIAPDERYDRDALYHLVNRLIPTMGWGKPRSRCNFNRWLTTLDLAGNHLYGGTELLEILLLAYWLHKHRRQGTDLYFTEKFWRDAQQTTAG